MAQWRDEEADGWEDVSAQIAIATLAGERSVGIELELGSAGDEAGVKIHSLSSSYW